MRKLLFLFLLTGIAATAQRNLTIQEATYGQYQAFAVKGLTSPQWQPETNTVTCLNDSYSALLARSESNNWSENTLLTKEDILTALKNKFPQEQFTMQIFPYSYTWKDKSTLSFETEVEDTNYLVLFNVDKKEVTRAIAINAKAAQQVLSPNNNYAASLNDNNIVITSASGINTVVTNDAVGIVNGSDYTHRQEFGIDRGMWWSPKSDKLLYYRKDETMVGNYPLVDFRQRTALEKDIKYPMAGLKSEEVTLVVYDVASAKKVTLKTDGPKEQFLTTITWSPDGKSIFVGVLNREQNDLKLNKYDAATGSFIKTLFEEKAPTYVEPLHPLTFVPGKNDEFLYRTEKDGYEQLYLYNTDGKLLKNLGYKDVVVTELLEFDAKAKNVYYIGTANNGLDRQLYQVNLKSGKTTEVTTTSGTHSIIMNSDATYALDSFSNTTTPNDVSIINLKNNKTTTLFKADNPYTGKTVLPKMELVTITAADGKTPLNGRLIYPADFDASKKYPVMVYVYGGPHAQLVTNEWLGGASLFDYYMAQKGYVVFTVDNRGSDARGRDFEHVIHRQLGQNEMADQMKGVEFLKSKPFVNQDKIGVYGWSFGGFMTTSLMTSYPETFKVGVAGGSVIDWKFYEVMYGERYMDMPQENPEGYAKTSLLDKAKNLQGRLLMIHGAQDNVVVQQHSMEFIQACIEAGKQIDYFLYPTHEHNVRGKDRFHLNQKIADYFDTYLKKD
ncbi:prolyl oligopeptidase family serine peptidase [Flavobacterium salilacus subsp. salilacus]|uniref:S9 family peptidase n=1 Tax=Flavobacterium TaxID=237 RepID=UPI001075030B|nr:MULTISPECIES: DPP IV N-terminal domain-containing protein [Flavobacterium]KAF2518787.1 prolyl oligopeptidase family serine peptidase [Flavobacterium salilacus subsp. salilacus]MBE1613755.1 DPP IV N-terminal domain-containing protein [Flavobacterium sp. SaA2.13]